MIEFLPETKGNLLAIKMSSTMIEEDYEKCLAEAESRLDRERVEHLLLDWENLQGWAPGARSAGTWFGMHYRALVGRVAIIADEKWADEVLRVTDIYRAAEVRRFSPVDRAAAFAWISKA